MLVLTRKEGESLIIDGEIKVTVLSIKGGQVRVGIEAPSSIPVHREELVHPKAKIPHASQAYHEANTTAKTTNEPQANGTFSPIVK